MHGSQLLMNTYLFATCACMLLSMQQSNKIFGLANDFLGATAMHCDAVEADLSGILKDMIYVYYQYNAITAHLHAKHNSNSILHFVTVCSSI